MKDRELLRRLAARPARGRIASDLHESATRYVARRRQQGATQQQLAEELHCSTKMIARWLHRARDTKLFVRVASPVARQTDLAAPSGKVQLRHPSGVVVEGLSTTDVVAVLRGLS